MTLADFNFNNSELTPDIYAFMDNYTATMPDSQLNNFICELYKTTGYYYDPMSGETFYVDTPSDCFDKKIINEHNAKPYGSDKMHTFAGLNHFLNEYDN